MIFICSPHNVNTVVSLITPLLGNTRLYSSYLLAGYIIHLLPSLCSPQNVGIAVAVFHICSLCLPQDNVVIVASRPFFTIINFRMLEEILNKHIVLEFVYEKTHEKWTKN